MSEETEQPPLFDADVYVQRGFGQDLNQADPEAMPHVAAALAKGYVFDVSPLNRAQHTFYRGSPPVQNPSRDLNRVVSVLEKYGPEPHQVDEAGFLEWRTTGRPKPGEPHANTVVMIHVDERHRGSGLAKALWEAARAQGPPPNHSIHRTGFGDAFSDSADVRAAGGHRPLSNNEALYGERYWEGRDPNSKPMWDAR